ncbi:DUF4314 domain-containing protein [Streptomyces sp. ME19-01-6]|uniref:DUF4314 domain-containing protein n=1 Tax=Streptomyces sp. ME19-01-6 TaxID=3028686 RepID=UPI0029A71202|nr:DUF4314 domain-containing protein [Streptomyces sp. ME19-01-6]MDX3224539.1 DUF4314 domain-containing protein [Streptomyces sp. ME19-01-6]
MENYRRGERVELVHTTDPYTELRPGDTGSVKRYDCRLRKLYVAWDGGSGLALLFDGGDAVRRI